MRPLAEVHSALRARLESWIQKPSAISLRTEVVYAVKSLIGPWIAVPAFVVEIANLLQRGMPWRGEGMWTVEWFAISLFVLGPICAGAAAVDAARLSRPGNIHLALAVPRPEIVYLRAAAWCALPVMLVHLAFISIAVVVWVERPSVSWGWLAFASAVQAVAIAWYVSLGSLLGRFASPLIAGLAGGGGGLATTYLLASPWNTDGFQLLDVGGATVSRLGLSYEAKYLFSQALILVVSAGLMLAVRIRLRNGTKVPSVRGWAGLLTAAVIVFGVTRALPGSRYTETAQEPTHCLSTQNLEVCLHAEHKRYAQELLADLDWMAAAAANAGYRSLIRGPLLESSRTFVSRSGSQLFSGYPYEISNPRSMRITNLAWDLVTPFHCELVWLAAIPQDRLEEWDYYWAVRGNLVFTWLVLTNELSNTDFAAVSDEYVQYTADEASEAMDALWRCDFAALGAHLH